MKKLAVVIFLALPMAASAEPYFRVGFNQVAGGMFWPLAGAESDRQAGFLTSVIEHRAESGYLLIPGLNYSLLNLGYIGETQGGWDNFFAGKIALGPSIQGGDLIKTLVRRAAENWLPYYTQEGSYGALKALLAPGAQGVYADVGIYGAIPLNRLTPLNHVQPELMIGASMVKRF